MMTTDQFKLALETKYVWPGGYALHFIAADGECLCHKCASSNVELVEQAIVAQHIQDDWRVIGAAVNWEDDSLRCAHCSDSIAPEYSEE